MTKRNRVDWKIKSKLNNFYSPIRCIVSGEENIEYHHLDENKENTIFENLVPLCPNCNSLIELNRRSINEELDRKLRPSKLLELSEELYVDGYYAHSYGVARLASFLAGPRKRGGPKEVEISTLSAPDAMEANARAIQALRICACKDLAWVLIADVLNRGIHKHLSNYEFRREVDLGNRSLLASQICALARDCGDLELAVKWGKLAIKLVKKISPANRGHSEYDAYKQYGLAHTDNKEFTYALEAALDRAESNVQKSTIQYWLIRKQAEAFNCRAKYSKLLNGYGGQPIKYLDKYPSKPKGFTMGTFAHLMLGVADSRMHYSDFQQVNSMVTVAHKFFIENAVSLSRFVKHEALFQYESKMPKSSRLFRQCPSDMDSVRHILDNIEKLLLL